MACTRTLMCRVRRPIQDRGWHAWWWHVIGAPWNQCSKVWGLVKTMTHANHEHTLDACIQWHATTNAAALPSCLRTMVLNVRKRLGTCTVAAI